MRHPARLLIVEDERVIALDLQRWVTRLGYTVVALTATGPEAIHQALEHRPDLVLMDIHLQGERDGVEAVQFIQAQVLIPVIYLSAYVDEITAARAGHPPRGVSAQARQRPRLAADPEQDIGPAGVSAADTPGEASGPGHHPTDRVRTERERLTKRRKSSVKPSRIVAPTRPPSDPIRLGCVALHAALNWGF